MACGKLVWLCCLEERRDVARSRSYCRCCPCGTVPGSTARKWPAMLYCTYEGERGIEKPGSVNSTGKSGDGTHINNDIQKAYGAPLDGQDSTNNRLATPALPRLPLPQPDIPSDAKSGLTTSKTASTNGCPLGAAGPATMISTQQRVRQCQRPPNAAHLTVTPRRR